MSLSTEQILIIFVAFTGLAVLLQACVLIAIFLSLKKTAKSALDATDDFKETVLPMVAETRALLERISPQVITVAAGLAELTEMLKKESRGVSISASEIMARVSRQSERLDGMLTNGLDAMERAGTAVESAVAVPVRQANGILAAIRAIVTTYRTTVPRRVPVQVDAAAAGRGFDPEI